MMFRLLRLLHCRLPGAVTLLMVAGSVDCGLAASQVSELESEVPGVVAAISVSVTARGTSVRGLDAEDFRLTEYDAPAAVERLETPEDGFNVVFVVDTTPGSELGLDWVRDLLSDTMARIDPGTQVAVIEAQSPPPEPMDLTLDRNLLSRAIGKLDATGRPTNRIYDRVVDAYLMLLDAGTPRGAVVVLTDGIDVGSSRGEDSFLRAVQVAGMPLYVLATDNAEGYSGGLGSRAESVSGGERFRAALSTLADQSSAFYETLRNRWLTRAESSGGAFFEVGDDDDEDRRTIERLTAHLNSTYTLYFHSRGPSAGADHAPVEVRVGPDVEVLAPSGIWYPEP